MHLKGVFDAAPWQYCRLAILPAASGSRSSSCNLFLEAHVYPLVGWCFLSIHTGSANSTPPVYRSAMFTPPCLWKPRATHLPFLRQSKDLMTSCNSTLLQETQNECRLCIAMLTLSYSLDWSRNLFPTNQCWWMRYWQDENLSVRRSLCARDSHPFPRS